MPSNDSSQKTRVAKTCCVCGIDTATIRRVKDIHGNYYCIPCHERLSEAQVQGASTPSPSTRGTSQGSPSATALQPTRLPGHLKPRVTCPHCWHVFPPEKVLWVANNDELRGDPVLGSDAYVRFLATRFTVDGHALDARGSACHHLACPRCHLTLPRTLLETEPLFISVVGVPSSGKSYFITSMTWELRRLLPTQFAIAFSDADTLSNIFLNENEEKLFLQNDPNKLVAIEKTEEQGKLYEQIRLGEQNLNLPKPLLFSLFPASHHPHGTKPAEYGRIVCMYDNAGESFGAGKDIASSPVTQHLGRARILFFLYDPTQDPRFCDLCRQFSGDPQVKDKVRTHRQETILTETAMRVRRYTGQPSNKKYDRPLVVVVPKLDIWEGLLKTPVGPDPIVPAVAGPQHVAAVDAARVEQVSAQVRGLLLQITPEFVYAAEEFCQNVVYIPVSALGCTPQPMGDKSLKGGGLGVSPKDIRPRWITVPFLYMFAKWSSGLIGPSRRPASADQPGLKTNSSVAGAPASQAADNSARATG